MPVRLKQSRVMSAFQIPASLIDLVFLLLIFFLVASTITDKDEAPLQLDLPQASEARPITARVQELAINITPEGKYYVRGQQLDANGLLQTLRQAAANNPGRQSAVIRADRNAAVQPLVTAIECCHKAQVLLVDIATAPPPR